MNLSVNFCLDLKSQESKHLGIVQQQIMYMSLYIQFDRP